MTRAAEITKIIGKGSVDIHGEAGTTSSGSTGKTTNLQQGLAKVWINYQQDSSYTVHDSLNISSVTDVSAGTGRPVHTNNMNNGKYSVAICCNQVNYNTSADTTLSGNNSSSTHETTAINTSNAGADASYISSLLHGDLA